MSYIKSFVKCLWWGIIGLFFMNEIVPLYQSFFNWMNPESMLDKFLYPVSFGFIFYLTILFFSKVNFYLDLIIGSLTEKG